MKLCPICNKRPAKRSCPALASSICSICCAHDRMIKLQCPESCEYLQAGRKSSIPKVLNERSDFIENQGLLFNTDAPGFVEMLTLIESEVVEVQRKDFRSLTDKDIHEGADTAIRTLETQKSGLIYQHQADSAAAQAVSEAVLEVINAIMNHQEPEKILSLSEMLTGLKVFSASVLYHIERGKDEREYLRFASQFYPYPEKKESLIIAP